MSREAILSLMEYCQRDLGYSQRFLDEGEYPKSIGESYYSAFYAAKAGVAPLEASSGQQTRHRLNRRGDRQLNRALHTIAITRTRHCPKTRAYIAKRISQGKTTRETRRCLKRYIARHLYRLLENPPPTPQTS